MLPFLLLCGELRLSASGRHSAQCHQKTDGNKGSLYSAAECTDCFSADSRLHQPNLTAFATGLSAMLKA